MIEKIIVRQSVRLPEEAGAALISDVYLSVPNFPNVLVIEKIYHGSYQLRDEKDYAFTQVTFSDCCKLSDLTFSGDEQGYELSWYEEPVISFRDGVFKLNENCAKEKN